MVDLNVRVAGHLEMLAQVMHGGQLLTVFSARNYLDLQSNDSALLLIAYDCDGKMRIRPKRLLHREGLFAV